MLFTAPIFLFAFLPAVIVGYFILKPLFANRLCNLFLLLASYLFYLFGAGRFALILLASTMVDYLLGLVIDRARNGRQWWVALSVVVNLSLLAYFKYANFFIDEFNTRLALWGIEPLAWVPVALPIGISFFTFQKISYIVDVYRKNTRALTSFVDFGLFVAMFPQLIAGPIVRFKDIREQLRSRQASWERFNAGAVRFCWGLAKKVLIADACGRIADAAFGLAPFRSISTFPATRTWLSAWHASSASNCWRTSTAPTPPSALRISGDDGTSR